MTFLNQTSIGRIGFSGINYLRQMHYQRTAKKIHRLLTNNPDDERALKLIAKVNAEVSFRQSSTVADPSAGHAQPILAATPCIMCWFERKPDGSVVEVCYPPGCQK